MSWFKWRIAIVTVIVFLLIPCLVPTRGTLENNITSFTYGFPFPWFTVEFESRGGSAILPALLNERSSGLDIDYITAILNLIILYSCIYAVFYFFSTRKYNWHKFNRKGTTKIYKKGDWYDYNKPKSVFDKSTSSFLIDLNEEGKEYNTQEFDTQEFDIKHK